MNPIRRRFILSMLSMGAAVLASRPALALNPQPEVPSKAGEHRPGAPKMLNPQPEVPSKSGEHHDGQIRMLNPQPEVPSKPKKSQKHRQQKSKPGPQP